MDFDIRPQDALPIYRQIVDQLRRGIASGQCQPGDELPSVRSLAQTHAINPMTVSKAYSLLEAEGLLERRRGMGMVVAEQASTAPGLSPEQLLQPALAAAAAQARQLGLSRRQALALFDQCLRDSADPESPSS